MAFIIKAKDKTGRYWGGTVSRDLRIRGIPTPITTIGPAGWVGSIGEAARYETREAAQAAADPAFGPYTIETIGG